MNPTEMGISLLTKEKNKVRTKYYFMTYFPITLYFSATPFAWILDIQAKPYLNMIQLKGGGGAVMWVKDFSLHQSLHHCSWSNRF